MLIASGRLGQRSETVRRANLSAIVRELHDARRPVAVGARCRTGLTRSAIRGLIGELVGGGLVVEERAAPLGTPGRPSPARPPEPDGAVVLALEIAVDSIAAAIVGLGGEVLERIRVDRPRGRLSVDDDRRGPRRARRRRLGRSPSDDAVVGIGVAVAGVVRRSDGLVSMAPEPRLARRRRSGTRLAARSGSTSRSSSPTRPTSAALAEHRRGAADRRRRRPVSSRARSASAAASIVDGKPLTGAAGYGGEIGHMPVNPDGLAVPLRVDRLLGDRGRSARRCCVVRVARRGRPDAVAELLAEAEAGDATALAALAETGRWLGIGLAGLINILNPRLVRARRAVRARSTRSCAPVARGGARSARPARRRAARAGRAREARRRCPAARRRGAGIRAVAGRPGGLADATAVAGRPGKRLSGRDGRFRIATGSRPSDGGATGLSVVA